MPTEGTTLEERFWAKVWRCTHRQPCKKCCWPWKGIDLSANWKCVWEQYAIFTHADLRWRTAPAHRTAYELTYGALAIHGKTFHMCHQCHFAPCCNPCHVRPGSASDNSRDNHTRSPHRTIVLPDGRVWSYAAACAAQDAFYEALKYQRVWAGVVPKRYHKRERELSQVRRDCEYWPGPSLARIFLYGAHDPDVPRRVLFPKDIANLQEDLRALAKRHQVSVRILCGLAQIDIEQAWTPVRV